MVTYRLLEMAPRDSARELLALARRRRFSPGEVIFHDGDPGDALHLIAKGHVAIRTSTPLGDVAMLRVVSPGEHFGELAVLEPGDRTGSAMAIDGVETMSLHRDAFDQARERIVGFDQIVMAFLVAEVRRLAALLTEALYVPVDKRLWRRLDDLAEIFGDHAADDAVTIPLTQEQLAQLAGTTRPTANRLLRPLADSGAIALQRGRIVIHDREAVHTHAR